ncbi:MAG: right-handed parallel beta-helix repeat-containing protein [Candidatus Thorarchaeota archaeon]
MDNWSKYSMQVLGMIVIIMLVSPVILSKHTSSDISKGQTEGSGPQDRFIPAYNIHGPITITSNAEFGSQGFAGFGTEEQPYVVEGYNITTTGTCIFIEDTDAYFVVRDCLLTGGPPGRGLLLNNVTHGEVRNNAINEKFNGLNFYESSNNTVVNNTISENGDGVVIVEFSNDNLVLNNTISGNNYGVYFTSSADSNAIMNNTITGNDVGVYLEDYSDNNTIESNTISGNYPNGVAIWHYSSNNTVVNNTISGNGAGVYCDTDTENNLIYLNVIAYNDGQNSNDDGTDNHWNTTGIGNSWSDYTGTGVYHIPGSAGSIDHYPFVYTHPTTTTTTTTTSTPTTGTTTTTTTTTTAATTTTTTTDVGDVTGLGTVILGVGVIGVVVVVLILMKYRRGT